MVCDISRCVGIKKYRIETSVSLPQMAGLKLISASHDKQGTYLYHATYEAMLKIEANYGTTREELRD